MSDTRFMDNRDSWTAQHRTLAVMPNHFPISALAVLMFRKRPINPTFGAGLAGRILVS